ncbi:hypothetical protein KKD80_02870 [Patescibacteria group bacterium]|nr:hypothetical protein [Patescibacteria group bacterium]
MFYRVIRIIFWLAFWLALGAAAFYGWQKNNFLLSSFLLGALALLLLYFLQKSAFVKKYYNDNFGNILLGLGGLIFLTTSLGTFYFYYYVKFFEYDLIAHTIIPASFVVMGAMLYEILRIKKGVPKKVDVLLISGILVLALSFFWEFFQEQGDIWWGTHMFFDSNQPIAVDVANDLAADAFGVFIGCVLIFKNWERWNKKWLKK